MSACPDRLPLIHGLVDGELDAANSLAVEAHLRACAGCAEELARIRALRGRLAAHDLAHRPPPGLAERIGHDLAAAAGPASPAGVPAGRGRFALGAVSGLAAGVALMLAVPRASPPAIEGQLVADHVRSLLAAHLTDVRTSDRHLVKPWFNGRIDFAPPVPDLAADGYPLAGGRVDYLDGRVVAAIIYQRRLHPINLFVRPAGGRAPAGAATARRDGYNLVRWTADGLEFWAVSDLNARELRQFQTLFLARATG